MNSSIRKKIIVVDDNIENLNALKNTLKEIYGIYPCPSASEMFNLLEHIQPDLILLDVEMPVMNGYETIKMLKNNDKYHEIPVIFLSAMSDEQSEMEGLKLGAVDYIHKPFVTPLLLQRIKIHLSLMEQQKTIMDRNKEIEELLEIKTKEVRLREKAEQEAQDASRAKSKFLSHMSHEIRSPLNAVLGMIIIAKEENDIQAVKRYLEKAGGAAKHILNVINDILDMSKIEANKLELSYDDFDFRKMLSNIIDVTGVRAAEKNQNITVNVDNNIPQYLISDEFRLSQVITNLMTNAIKFTPENGKITINAEIADGADSASGEFTLKIEVADSGIGISPEQQAKLFTSYNQADHTITKNFGGTGLGLAISKRIVELMRGTIWIESELGKGAKFIFTIKTKEGTDKAGSASSDELKETDFNFKGYTVLAVEDIDINREVISAFLEKTGISIDFAVNGKEAVSMFKERHDTYSLILMDINMPEMDGDEATRIIRALDIQKAKNIPIIAMTADAFREDIDKCLSAGMNDHVAKPIDPKIMFMKINHHLGLSKGIS